MSFITITYLCASVVPCLCLLMSLRGLAFQRDPLPLADSSPPCVCPGSCPVSLKLA
jgi:hypothetical protein